MPATDGVIYMPAQAVMLQFYWFFDHLGTSLRTSCNQRTFHSKNTWRLLGDPNCKCILWVYQKNPNFHIGIRIFSSIPAIAQANMYSGNDCPPTQEKCISKHSVKQLPLLSPVTLHHTLERRSDILFVGYSLSI